MQKGQKTRQYCPYYERDSWPRSLEMPRSVECDAAKQKIKKRKKNSMIQSADVMNEIILL